MSIDKRQNSSLNLKRLAAQRQLYSEAKKIMYVQFLISIIAVVLLSILGNILSEKYVVYITVFSILLLLVDEIFLARNRESITYSAAIIQEEFDCDVLDIPKNHMKEIRGSMLEIIQLKSQKYIQKHGNYGELENWYRGIDETGIKFGKIICMSTNCWWNQELRKKYSFFLTTITIIVFMILLIVALINGISLSSFIGSVFAPFLPGAVLVYKMIRDNNNSIRNLNHTKNKLDEITEKFKMNVYPEAQLDVDVRLLQDMIFDNRANSPVIPDKFYFFYRNNDEVIAESTNKELVELINKRQRE